MRVIVVGAGVVGLTCAVRLAEAGHRVDVIARDLPLETTSAVAAALWYPYLAEPRDRVLGWARTSYGVFETMAATDSGAGVVMRHGREVFHTPEPEPWWASAVPDLRRDRPAGFADGWTFRAPIVEMPVYLAWLQTRLADLGGTITRLNLSALPAGADLVVNAAGLGSRLLAADHSVQPVRGQVLWVEQVGLTEWWLESGTDITYVVPRAHDIVLGGTDEEGDWSRTPSPASAEAIRQRTARLVPALAKARVLRHRVGLRPVRPQVRVERVGDVVHCYGHGGAGVTLSWGTADEVVSLAGAG